MDYNKLAVFLRVCETKSFTQAAHSLRRTQSAVSQQVCLLEDDLGLSLIHRARGGLRLTAVGEALFETLRRSLGQIDDVVGDLTDRSSRASGEIRIGVLHEMGSERAIGVVSTMKRAYPNVNLNFQFKNFSWEIERALESEELDFGLVIRIKNPPLYDIHTVHEIQFVLAAAPAYLSQHEVATVRDLLAADLIDFTNDFTSISYWMRTNAPRALHGLRAKVPIAVVPNHSAVHDLVKAGIGVGAIQPRLFKAEFRKGLIVEVPLSRGRPFNVPIRVMGKRRRHLRAFEKKFVDLLLQPTMAGR